MESSDLSSIMSRLARIESKVDGLGIEIRALKSDLRTLMGELIRETREINRNLETINSNITETRLDLSARLLMVKALSALLDYADIRSRLDSLKVIKKAMTEKMEEVLRIFREKYGEIMRDYLNAIGDFFNQFVRRARNDLELMRSILRNEERVEALYATLEPEYVDDEILDIAVSRDIAKRIEALKDIKEKLTAAADELEQASKVAENFYNLLLKYEVKGLRPPSDRQLLLLPVVKVSVRLGEDEFEDTTGPLLSWETRNALSEQAARYVSESIENYPLPLSDRDAERLKELLLGLAESDDERELLEKVEIEVS